MSERGETDSRSIGSSDKFRATAVRRNVVNHQTSDESQFSLSSDCRRVTIWKERGTKFKPRNITKRYHFPSRGVMVWTDIMMDGCIDLHFFDTGSVTAQRYRDEFLESYVRLFQGAVCPDFIFMDDNVAFPPSAAD
ncbi:transposable element Tcb2 transposase [Trichonephila clavipes]|nr:transposable element Tcb2 transposase [Trichonephila clavipes]